MRVEGTACSRHPDARAAWRCRGCETNLCPDCAASSPIRTGGEMISCAHCGGVADVLLVRRRIAPYWDVLPKFLSAMVSKEGLVQLIAVGAMAYLLGLVPGLIGFALEGFVVAGYFFHVLSRAAHGAESLPEPDDFTGFDSVAAVVKNVVAAVLVLAPAAVVLATSGRTPGAMLLAAITLAYYPAVLIAGGISESLIGALNPLITVRLILRIPGQYALTVVVWLALTALDALVRALLAGLVRAVPLPVIVPLIASVLSLPVTVTTAFVLGRLIFQNAEDFGAARPEALMIPEWPDARPKAQPLGASGRQRPART